MNFYYRSDIWIESKIETRQEWGALASRKHGAREEDWINPLNRVYTNGNAALLVTPTPGINLDPSIVRHSCNVWIDLLVAKKANWGMTLVRALLSHANEKDFGVFFTASPDFLGLKHFIRLKKAYEKMGWVAVSTAGSGVVYTNNHTPRVEVINE